MPRKVLLDVVRFGDVAAVTVGWGILLVLVSRAANVFPLAAVANRYREEPISRKTTVVMWFSGLRGAIAFALSLSFPAEDGSGETRRVVISTTLAIVLFTVIVLGGGTMPLLRLLRVDTAEGEAPAGDSSAFLPLPAVSMDAPGGRGDAEGGGGDWGGDGSNGSGVGGSASSLTDRRGRLRGGGRDPSRPASRFGLDDSDSGSGGDGEAAALAAVGRGGEAGAAASADLLGGDVPSQSPRWVGDADGGGGDLGGGGDGGGGDGGGGDGGPSAVPSGAAATGRYLRSRLPLLQRLDETYVKPLLLAAPHRGAAADSRALARLTAAGDAMLSPEEMGAVLAAPAGAVPPSLRGASDGVRLARAQGGGGGGSASRPPPPPAPE